MSSLNSLRTNGFQTVCHGAPWQENCLLWSDDDCVKEVMLANYHHARVCQPAADIAILLYTSTTRHQRQETLATLLRSYHRTLMDTLKTIGHKEDVYPFSQLFQDYQVSLWEQN